MRVKVHQRHFTEVLRVGAQQRQGHEVVTAEGEHAFTGRQQLLGVRLQFFAHFARVTEGVHQITAVHHVQALAHVEVPREAVVLPGQVGGNLTNCRRAMTSTRTTGRCHVERYAGDHPVSIAVVRLEVHRKA